MIKMCKKVSSAVQNQTLLCERDRLMQTVTELTSLCEPSTKHSHGVWLEKQCSTV